MEDPDGYVHNTNKINGDTNSMEILNFEEKKKEMRNIEDLKSKDIANFYRNRMVFEPQFESDDKTVMMAVDCLSKLGYCPTTEELKGFQEESRLPPNGIVDIYTLYNLASAYLEDGDNDKYEEMLDHVDSINNEYNSVEQKEEEKNIKIGKLIILTLGLSVIANIVLIILHIIRNLKGW